MTNLGTLVDQIDNGTVLLPEFQRGYVWNRDQVRALMRSLYLGYPVGGLLVWETEAQPGAVRGDGAPLSSGTKQLLLDGQQRVTSLYGVVRGKPPAFFEGNSDAFTGLRFNVETETFEFFAPSKMKDDPRWVDVTTLFAPDGVTTCVTGLQARPDLQPKLVEYMTRLVRLKALVEREFHTEKITGADKTIDVVVDIFNKVNSGGTKLSKGDLALAKLCADWPEARSTMRKQLATWHGAGYRLSLDWLLRNATAVATGKAPFSSLEPVPAAEFQQALTKTGQHVSHLLDLIAGRLGLDHDRVLMGRYAIPVLSRLLHHRGGKFADQSEQDRALYWYVHTALWGRFSGSTETVLAQDYETVNNHGVDGLITSLERWRGGNLTIAPYDFEGFSKGSRFYPLLYLLTRVRAARDLGNGLPLHSQLLGHLGSLQVHHIFPKAMLYAEGGYTRSEVNDVANFCFLTQNSNLVIGKRKPEDYFAETATSFPGALESQWIPMERDLWRPERFHDFLTARRALLAEAANTFLDELRSGRAAAGQLLERVTTTEPPMSEPDPREADIVELVAWMTSRGYAEPERDIEITDPDTGRVLAVAEAHWPDGLQPGLGSPVVLELDREEMDQDRLESLGYQVFSTVLALHDFVDRGRADLDATEEEDSDANADASTSVTEPSSPAETPAPPDLERLFHRGMVGVYERAKKEAGYNATVFLRMLADHGGLGTARRLLAAPDTSDGFAALYERHRLDLTVEALVLRPEFTDLFTGDEIETARDRLERLGWTPPR